MRYPRFLCFERVATFPLSTSSCDTPAALCFELEFAICDFRLSSRGSVNQISVSLGALSHAQMSEPAAPINLRVVDQNGDELAFKLKPDTKLEKLFAAYAGQKGLDVKSVAFSFDGERLKNEDTPKMFEMQDSDQSEYSLLFVRVCSFISLTHQPFPFTLSHYQSMSISNS